jgi:hypothetical protein
MNRSQTCGRPPEGSRDLEVYHRFADFLAEAGQPSDLRMGIIRRRTAAQAWRFGFLLWRLTPISIDLSERLHTVTQRSDPPPDAT